MGDFSYLKRILSRNLRLFRRSKKITQDQLEELSGVSRYTISDIETCESWPGDETLEKLASALNIKPTDFFNDSGNPIKDISVREDTFIKVKQSLKNIIDNAIDDMDTSFSTMHSKKRK